MIRFSGVSLIDERKLESHIELELPLIRVSHLENLPPGYRLARELYRSYGIDPTRHRPSSEALWRRVKKGLDFPRLFPVVDLTNLMSLKFQVCYGLYDVRKIEKGLTCSVGKEGDAYEGIKKERVNLVGRPMLSDPQGPFGNPSADSQRSRVTESTRDILQVLFFQVMDPLAENILSESKALFLRFFEVESEESLLN